LDLRTLELTVLQIYVYEINSNSALFWTTH